MSPAIFRAATHPRRRLLALNSSPARFRPCRDKFREFHPCVVPCGLSGPSSFALTIAACLALPLSFSAPGPAWAQSSSAAASEGSGSGDEGGTAASEMLALQSLLTVLQDDAAREELVTQLQSVLDEGEGEDGSGDTAGEGEGATPAPPPSIPRPASRSAHRSRN